MDALNHLEEVQTRHVGKFDLNHSDVIEELLNFVYRFLSIGRHVGEISDFLKALHQGSTNLLVFINNQGIHPLSLFPIFLHIQLPTQLLAKLKHP